MKWRSSPPTRHTNIVTCFAHVHRRLDQNYLFLFIFTAYPPPSLLFKPMDTNNTIYPQQCSHSSCRNMVPIVEQGMRQPKTCQKCRDSDAASKKRKREAQKASKAASASAIDGLESVAKKRKGSDPVDHKETDTSDDDGIVSTQLYHILLLSYPDYRLQLLPKLIRIASLSLRPCESAFGAAPMWNFMVLTRCQKTNWSVIAKGWRWLYTKYGRLLDIDSHK